MSDPLRAIAADESGNPPPELDFWLKELNLAKQREKKWREAAEKYTTLYEGGKKQENSFNILYSNTETLLPACYNQLPRPVVERRFKDKDPLAKASSQTLERTLSYLMDSPDAEYDPFSSLMEQAVLGALVPGRGVTRFKYDPDIQEEEAESAKTGDEMAEELDEEKEPSKKVVYETICGEDIDYDAFLMGYARRWVDVPWIAFYHDMTKADLEANFGKKLAAVIPLTPPTKREMTNWKKAEDTTDGENNRGSVPTAAVFEIWDKRKKQVVFIAPDYKNGVLKTVEDPLELSGFYPCPEPLMFLLKRSGLTPTPLYTLYREQAEELNRVSMRINRVLNALKVRGFYDKAVGGLQDLMNKDDNTLMPMQNPAAWQDGKDVGNSIWLMPLDELVKVYQQLVQGREAIKQTIYEITGIADIMRGQGEASETATAQNIKNQWGTLRMKRAQRYVQRYVRDCLRIMGEIAGKHFDVSTFEGMTNLDYSTPEEVQQADQLEMVVQQAQLALPPPQAQGPVPGQAPPAGPQLPPQIQQAQQFIAEVRGKPAWDDVVGLLRNDLQRYYRVDIETNSTVEATSQEDKQNITDAMQAIANTVQTFEEPMMKGLIPPPVFKALVLSVARRFEFGRQVEESLDQIPDQLPPPPPDPKLEAIQAQAQSDQQLAQTQIQALQQKTALDQQKNEMQLQLMQQKLALEKQAHEQEMAARMQEFQLKLDQMRQEFELKMGLTQAKAAVDTQVAQTKGAVAVQTAQVVGEQKAQDAAQNREIRAQDAAQNREIRASEAAQARQLAARQPKPTKPKA